MTIRIDGPIVADADKWLYDWFGEPAVSPAALRVQMPQNSHEPLVVWINSPGGDMAAGGVIYCMLMEHKGDVTVKIDGDAASAASLIAMAGNQVLVSPLGMMMIHRVWTIAQGNAREMEQAGQMLDEADEACINAYEIKTGLPRAEIFTLMEANTWMSAARAVELGFADGMLYQDKPGTMAMAARAASIAHGYNSTDALMQRAQAMIDLEKMRY